MKKIFAEAHKRTRRFVERYEVDYQAQFGIFVSFLVEEQKQEKLETLEDIKELVKKNMDLVKNETNFDIERFEMREWKKYGKHRIYFNISINTKGNTARNADGYIDVKNLDIFSTNKEQRRYNEKTIQSIYDTIADNSDKIVKIVS